MNLKVIDEKDFRVMSLNMQEINIKMLSQKEKELYFMQYSLYRKLFTEYIIELLNLKKYDDELMNSRLNFLKVNNTQMDIYQYFSSEILKYFYIRNNIYIENLNEIEKKWLEEKINKKKYDLDDISKKMISNTFKKVIFEDIQKDGKKYNVFFGPNTNYFMAENDSLVIGMRYDEFNTNNLTDDDWNQLYEQQQLYIYSLFVKLKYEFKEILKIPVELIKYNEYSVNFRN